MRIIAHRGASAEAPENTLEALALAGRQGADGVEVDVRLSKDGVPVIIHDETLDRTAGIPEPVRSFKQSDLARMDVGAWKGDAWRNSFIPALDQFLDACPHSMDLFLELKEDPASVAPVLARVKASRFPISHLAFLSFRRDVLLRIHRQWPEVRVYLNVSQWGDNPGRWMRPGENNPWTGIGWECPAPGTEPVLRPYWERGGDGYVWTVDDFDIARALRSSGAPRLLTNRPGAMIRALESAS